MRRRCSRFLSLVLIGLALAGCAKCGGWEKFNTPWGASGCEDASRAPH